MANYTPPVDDPFASIVGDSNPTNTADKNAGEELGNVYRAWSGLHQHTRRNLLQFEDSEFQLPERAEGDIAVRELVSRLHIIFKQVIDPHNTAWPTK
jgi:hypothetical protein